jgi:HPt (histidine-containing phosphotransfer) domain-containing protein
MNSDVQTLERFVDMTELNARVDNDRELLVELLTLFQTEFPRLHEALHAAIDSGNLNQVEEIAHTLKGMLANLAIKLPSQLAAGVEFAARAGDAQEVQKAVARFDREEAGLLAAVEAFIAGRNP